MPRLFAYYFYPKIVFNFYPKIFSQILCWIIVCVYVTLNPDVQNKFSFENLSFHQCCCIYCTHFLLRYERDDKNFIFKLLLINPRSKLCNCTPMSFVCPGQNGQWFHLIQSLWFNRTARQCSTSLISAHFERLITERCSRVFNYSFYGNSPHFKF